jgi:hypothetical protein
MYKKLGRNEKCHCKSGKKYKQCCLNKDDVEKAEKKETLTKQYNDGHEITEDVSEMYDHFTEKYPSFKIIDISNVLTSTSYRPIQTIHYEDDTIMLANRTEENDEVFSTRGDGSTDWMVMFRGAHQVFSRYSFAKMKDALDKMITCRLKGEDYTF